MQKNIEKIKSIEFNEEQKAQLQEIAKNIKSMIVLNFLCLLML